MPRFIILGIIILVVLTLYAVIDCAMTESRRIRVMPKQLWIVAVLLLPLVGPVCWILFGKGLVTITSNPERKQQHGRRAQSPDDDPEFLRQLRAYESSSSATLRRLEAELAALDAEDPRDPRNPAAGRGDAPKPGTPKPDTPNASGSSQLNRDGDNPEPEGPDSPGTRA